MDTPQLENGFTKIANEILEKLSQTYISANEWQVLIVILRRTYGFNKKSDWISNSQFSEATGIAKSN
ncbi:MAG: replication protein, partial [Ignavibacteria bacterium]|nr:replication protein [Ignavibacteria bacterium]